MLEVVALSYNGIAPALPVIGQLPPTGGSIGRGEDNSVVLPDPMRALSRQHLRVEPDETGQSDSYRLTNISDSNPALLNNVALASGESRVLHHGDQIFIGGYLLEVRITASGQAQIQPQPPRQPEPPPPEPQADVSPPPTLDTSRANDTVLNTALPDGGVQEVGMPEVNQPAADISGMDIPASGSSDTSLQDLGIQDMDVRNAPPGELDTDFNADVNAILERGSTRPLATGDPLGVATIDQTIGLTDLSDPDGKLLAGLGRDTPAMTAAQLHQDPLTEHTTPLLQTGELDPLALFGGEQAVVSDLFGEATTPAPETRSATPTRPMSDLRAPFSLDTLTFHTTEPAATTAAAASRAVPIPEPDIDDNPPAQSSHAQTSIAGVPDPVPPAHSHVEPTSAAPVAPVSASKTPSTPSATPAASAASPNAAPTSTDDIATLHAALLEGLELDSLPAQRPLDADLMRTLGVLLRASIDGALRLLAARATVKREVRANVTVIAPERNNPLKFSPDADVALMYLLGRDYPGFLAAPEAVRTTFADLLSHQIGMVAGMRSALSLVLERFDPEHIRHRTDTGTLDKLLSVSRKVRLWDAYERYFESTQELAIDGFQEFFGAAFVDAYEGRIQNNDTLNKEEES